MVDPESGRRCDAGGGVGWATQGGGEGRGADDDTHAEEEVELLLSPFCIYDLLLHRERSLPQARGSGYLAGRPRRLNFAARPWVRPASFAGSQATHSAY